MDRLKQKVLASLRGAGFQAQAGLPWSKGSPLKEETICLRLRQAEMGQRAACYLGTDEQEQEQFSAELTVELGLVLLSPREKGGAGCEAFGEQVFSRLLEGIDGFPTEELRLGESGYDSVRDCFTAELRTVSRVTVYVVKTEDGPVITDFVLRGNRR